MWDTLAIGEYLNEISPMAHLLPEDRAKRARCRSISGEMHSGFGSDALGLADEHQGRLSQLQGLDSGPSRYRPNHRDLAGVPRLFTAGPFLLGERSMADAMYAPVVTRFLTYHVKLDEQCAAYCETIMAMPEMVEWVGAAKEEPENWKNSRSNFEHRAANFAYHPAFSAHCRCTRELHLS